MKSWRLAAPCWLLLVLLFPPHFDTALSGSLPCFILLFIHSRHPLLGLTLHNMTVFIRFKQEKTFSCRGEAQLWWFWRNLLLKAKWKCSFHYFDAKEQNCHKLSPASVYLLRYRENTENWIFFGKILFMSCFSILPTFTFEQIPGTDHLLWDGWSLQDRLQDIRQGLMDSSPEQKSWHLIHHHHHHHVNNYHQARS